MFGSTLMFRFTFHFACELFFLTRIQQKSTQYVFNMCMILLLVCRSLCLKFDEMKNTSSCHWIRRHWCTLNKMRSISNERHRFFGISLLFCVQKPKTELNERTNLYEEIIPFFSCLLSIGQKQKNNTHTNSILLHNWFEHFNWCNLKLYIPGTFLHLICVQSNVKVQNAEKRWNERNVWGKTEYCKSTQKGWDWFEKKNANNSNKGNSVAEEKNHNDRTKSELMCKTFGGTTMKPTTNQAYLTVLFVYTEKGNITFSISHCVFFRKKRKFISKYGKFDKIVKWTMKKKNRKWNYDFRPSGKITYHYDDHNTDITFHFNNSKSSISSL